ncbi:Hypothetical predicted protein [Scomber scombrus]|uniref:Uncharacterized protein n=1 Tax=Scomber scombrus TaxID=13677 RepID=A0AAV1Q5D0_SCOSC
MKTEEEEKCNLIKVQKKKTIKKRRKGCVVREGGGDRRIDWTVNFTGASQDRALCLELNEDEHLRTRRSRLSGGSGEGGGGSPAVRGGRQLSQYAFESGHMTLFEGDGGIQSAASEEE